MDTYGIHIFLGDLDFLTLKYMLVNLVLRKKCIGNSK